MRDYTTLDKIATIYNGNSINADYKKKHFFGLETGFPFIATKDVSFNGEVNYYNGVRIPFNTEYKIAEAGSVFICAEGGSAGRKIAYITEKVCFGNKLFCIQPKDEKYLGRFLYYYLMSDTFQSQFKLMLTGLIGGVSAKKFKAFTVPVATFAEQERIVALLDDQFAKIDQLKANAASQLQAAKDLFQSALKQLLTPQEGWEMKTLGDIAEKTADGPFGSNLKAEHYTKEKQVRIIQLSNIGEDGWRDENTKYTTFEHLLSISRSEVFPGNIVIAKMMPAGRAILCPNTEKRYVLSSDAVKIELKKGLCSKYILYYINSEHFNKQVLENVSGSGRIRTSLTKLRACKLRIPSLAEQERIAARLDEISEKVKTLQANYDQTITLCNDLKQSLLKSIFA